MNKANPVYSKAPISVAHNSKKPILFLLINLAIISSVIIYFLNLKYPMVGHDYSLAIPHMLDSGLHYRVNGLSIQWYTPGSGGGLPAFPNPNNVQFSLPGILSVVMSPWYAVIASTVFFVFIGGIGCYYLLNRILNLHWTAAILGAIFFSANGFMMQRIAVGHLCYQTFPLIAVIMVILLSSSFPLVISGLLFALLVALLVHQAGYFLIIIFGLSLLITFPLLYVYRPEVISWKRVVQIILSGGSVALLLSASKLGAVYSFMRFFPRTIADTYDINPIMALWGIISQLLGTMNLVPMLLAAGQNQNFLGEYMHMATRALYGYWEFDMSLSPVAIGILVIGSHAFFQNRKAYFEILKLNKNWLALFILVLSIWVTIEFILAKGLIYPYLCRLPILSSLHVNPRFAAAFIFPIVFSAAAIYNNWAAKRQNPSSVRMFILFNLLTLIPLGAYFIISKDLQFRYYNIADSFKIHDAIAAGNTFPITTIKSEPDKTKIHGMGISNLRPYEPIFGYGLETFHPEIKEGSIWDISDGYYNMTNPAGYVFPEINNTRPFERIHVADKDKLTAFAGRYQPDWKIPLYQQMLNWISALIFLATLSVLSVYTIITGGRRLLANLRYFRN